ncbi:chemotaxis protein CheW [Pleurocapsa sp. FMAR1]|uniref:chemotaxis protein CheW n=1 Tax=Pleurocapsa sp. FMAR1 TaxID=3040204 RepID=UPI0029C93C9B|nr:chemotaxis protein CheW [Pleurocapsa sp. FMAR1]
MSNQSVAAKVQANLPELFKSNLAPGNAYIKFQLTSDITALLSTDRVEESLIVKAEQITTLPSMPKSAIGMMASRDRVFCVFDLAQLLTLPSKLITPRQYQIIVLQTTDQTPIQVGLAVNSVQGIMRLATKQISSSTDAVSPQIAPYISGAVNVEQTTIPVLEFERILQALETLL